jgi:hypothetical protein
LHPEDWPLVGLVCSVVSSKALLCFFIPVVYYLPFCGFGCNFVDLGSVGNYFNAYVFSLQFLEVSRNFFQSLCTSNSICVICPAFICTCRWSRRIIHSYSFAFPDLDKFEEVMRLFILKHIVRVIKFLGAVQQLRQLVAGFHCGGPGSSRGQVMWDLWWPKRHSGRFSPGTSVYPANHSTYCSTVIIHHHPGLVQ